jgi:hypothetical protein
MTTIRSIRLPDEIIKDLDEATVRDGYKSFNKFANHLIDDYMRPKLWLKTHPPSKPDLTKRVSFKIKGMKALTYILNEDEWDFWFDVPENEDVVIGDLPQENFDELVRQGLISEADVLANPAPQCNSVRL